MGTMIAYLCVMIRTQWQDNCFLKFTKNYKFLQRFTVVNLKVRKLTAKISLLQHLGPGSESYGHSKSCMFSYSFCLVYEWCSRLLNATQTPTRENFDIPVLTFNKIILNVMHTYIIFLIMCYLKIPKLDMGRSRLFGAWAS